MTPKVEAELIVAIAEYGLNLKTACAYAGVSYETMNRKRGKDAAFAEKVDDALERFKANMQVLIAKHAITTPSAAQWALERRFPGQFGRRLEVAGPEGGAIPISAKVDANGDLAQQIRENPDAFREFHALLVGRSAGQDIAGGVRGGDQLPGRPTDGKKGAAVAAGAPPAAGRRKDRRRDRGTGTA
jgi:hypothetical protein